MKGLRLLLSDSPRRWQGGQLPMEFSASVSAVKTMRAAPAAATRCAASPAAP